MFLILIQSRERLAVSNASTGEQPSDLATPLTVFPMLGAGDLRGDKGAAVVTRLSDANRPHTQRLLPMPP